MSSKVFICSCHKPRQHACHKNINHPYYHVFVCRLWGWRKSHARSVYYIEGKQAFTSKPKGKLKLVS